MAYRLVILGVVRNQREIQQPLNESIKSPVVFESETKKPVPFLNSFPCLLLYRLARNPIRPNTKLSRPAPWGLPLARFMSS
jgi:hypothetical protein